MINNYFCQIVLEKDLKPTPVFDYPSIQKLMEKGNANRIIAETKMNANSRFAFKMKKINCLLRINKHKSKYKVEHTLLWN